MKGNRQSCPTRSQLTTTKRLSSVVQGGHFRRNCWEASRVLARYVRHKRRKSWWLYVQRFCNRTSMTVTLAIRIQTLTHVCGTSTFEGRFFLFCYLLLLYQFFFSIGNTDRCVQVWCWCMHNCIITQALLFRCCHHHVLTSDTSVSKKGRGRKASCFIDSRWCLVHINFRPTHNTLRRGPSTLIDTMHSSRLCGIDDTSKGETKKEKTWKCQRIKSFFESHRFASFFYFNTALCHALCVFILLLFLSWDGIHEEQRRFSLLLLCC